MSIRATSHIAICVSDIERSIEFYCGALGFELKTRIFTKGTAMDHLLELDDAELEIVFIGLQGSLVELVHFKKPTCLTLGNSVANRLGYTHLSLRVDDFDGTLDALIKKGVSIKVSTSAQDENSNSKFTFILDPDGTRIELIGPIDDSVPTIWDALKA